MNNEKVLKVVEILTDRITDLETSLRRMYDAYKSLKEESEVLTAQLEASKKQKENKGENK